MTIDRNGLEVLSRPECLHLLGASRVGRLVVTERALPAAFPVQFALLAEDVLFVTRRGSALEAATAGQVVAFEADDMDPAMRSGWSVLIQGAAGTIDDPDELAGARGLPLAPWGPGTDAQLVRVRSEIVSGRRILPRLASGQPVRDTVPALF
jgi:hypothetical protein